MDSKLLSYKAEYEALNARLDQLLEEAEERRLQRIQEEQLQAIIEEEINKALDQIIPVEPQQ